MPHAIPLAMAIATLTWLLGASPRPEQTQNPTVARAVDIDVSVLTSNCADFKGALSYSTTIDGEKEGGRNVVPVRLSDGVYRFSFMLPPGHYWLYVSTPKFSRQPWPEGDSGYLSCVTDQMFTVIPNHARHLAVSLGENQTPHPNCSLAGTLPAKGFGVALIIPRGNPVPDTVTGGSVGTLNEPLMWVADIDGDAFYIEHIQAWKYVLRIRANMSEGDIPIDLSKGWNADNPYCTGVFIHNVTPLELKGLFRPNWVTE
jgi:hypothetical protein